jgi:FixJ family two-component response regulator
MASTHNPTSHVYLIDDNPDIRLFLSQYLSQSGYCVETHADAESFLSRSRHRTPAVILLDMRLAGMSGLELQRRLRAAQRHTPIVFISGESKSQEIIDAMKGGAVDFLWKPFSMDELLTAVERGIDQDRLGQAQAGRLAELRRCHAQLTQRERELLVLMLAGHGNSAISERIGVQAGTIKKHRAAIFGKFGIATTAELIALFKDVDLDALHGLVPHTEESCAQAMAQRW